MAQASQTDRSYSLNTREREEQKQMRLMKAYLVNAALLIPGLALTIPYAVTVWDNPMLPAAGLIPMGVGSIFSFYRAVALRSAASSTEYRILLPEVDGSSDNEPFLINKALKINKAVESTVNLVLGFAILAALIPTWATASDSGWYRRPEWLGAYATVPMMAAMMIHWWIALRTIPLGTWTKRRNSKVLCSRCSGSTEEVRQASPKISGAIA